MLGELVGGILDEFNGMSIDASEKRNRQILKNSWMMASTGATMAGWKQMILTMPAPMPVAPSPF
ncbi:MAG TPA: hypothetical protein VIF12_01450 [Micavibrio sp.]